MPPKEKSHNWFAELLKSLPTTKLTAAQTGNLIMDALGLILLSIYAVNNPPPKYLFILTLVILSSMIWCHIVSKPKR